MHESMEIYPRTAAERAMKLHEVLLRATARKITWWQTAELTGMPGMLLHIDGSDHRWFHDKRRHDLIVILDDANGSGCFPQESN